MGGKLVRVDGRQLDRMMRRWAERQHCLVARDQLRGEGVSRQAVATRLRSPDWEEVTPRVLRLVGSQATREQRAMAAVLDAGHGGVLSHGAAAGLWDLPGFDLRRLHLSRPRGSSGRRSTALATVHHPNVLAAHHVTRRHDIPVTTLARTVVDLGATEHPARAELALHAAIRLGVTWRAIERTVDELAGRGRPGIGVVRALLLDQNGRPPLGSGLEGAFLRILLAAGLPEPRRQVDLGGGAWVGRVDFFYDDVLLVIEVNGSWHHDGELAVRRDQRRAAALTAAGFHVLMLPETLIRTASSEVVRIVIEARRWAARELVRKATCS